MSHYLYYDKGIVGKQTNSKNELLAAAYFLNCPNDFIIPIISVSFRTQSYTMARGLDNMGYGEPALIPWLQRCYNWMKENQVSHNDIHINPSRPNIVRYKGSYRLIDLEQCNIYRSSAKDFFLIGQLINRIERNIREDQTAYFFQ